MPHTLRRRLLAAGSVLGVVALATASQTVAAGDDATQAERTYVVLYSEGADAAAARDAITKAGGTVVEENGAVGLARVTSTNAGFTSDVARSTAVRGAATERTIGHAPTQRPKDEEVERQTSARRQQRGRGRGGRPGHGRPGHGTPGKPGKPGHGGPKPVTPEPLADRQWDMDMIDADPDGSYRRQQGDRAVRVGVIDTGIDGSHPDIAPNFNRELSRNFTVDDPTVDGPCEEEPDRSCTDPADVDENEHGTHVAGTIASPLNGQGIGGVAPKVELVNLRAGQDYGYFFLQPTVDAITYAADNGIDVVNMSFYIDPWLFNCTANPADTPEDQLEQRTIIEATQRALRYARERGVTLIAAEGNQAIDLGNPSENMASPGYPPGAEYQRDVDNSCLTLPTEGEGVVGVTSVGPSGRKAYYSSYGTEQADVSAPGGDTRDHPAAPESKAEAGILAPAPKAVLEARGDLDPDGTPNNPFVVQDQGAYYQYLQGTSMAAPHAAGVAALIVSQYGQRDRRGGKTLAPATVERILSGTAVDTPCLEPRTFVYPGLPAAYTATCEGTPQRNGFFGDGLVNALRAVSLRP